MGVVFSGGFDDSIVQNLIDDFVLIGINDCDTII